MKFDDNITMTFCQVEVALPNNYERVLVRGCGEAKKHYVYAFAKYEIKTACRQWLGDDGSLLHFEPIEWARLPQHRGNNG